MVSLTQDQHEQQEQTPLNQAASRSPSAPRRRRGLILRGEHAVASIGIAAAAILLGAMAALGWWTTRSQKQYFADARREQVRAIGSLLSQSAEVLLPAEELSAARRMVAETAANYDLSQCRIVLADGRVIADADPSQITVQKLPANWQGPAALADENVSGGGDGRSVNGSFPLNIAGHGAARLELGARVTLPRWATWETQTAVGAVGAASLVGLLVVYRRTRVRLRGMCAVHEALGALAAGETSPAVLGVNGSLGVEAQAWNWLLAERETARSRDLAAQAAETLGSRGNGASGAGGSGGGGGRSDLDAAFDAMSQGVLLVDDRMRVKHINGAASSFLRAKRDTASGADIGKIIEQPDVLESIQSVVTGNVRKKTTIEVERHGEDNSANVLRFSIRPVRREDHAAAMVLIEDITQQKVAEQSRNAFVAHATHELRTPLTNIRLYLETVMEDGDRDPAIRGKCLNVINQEARRLERIVGEMLSVSEIEAGSLRLRTDDVRLDVLLSDLQVDYMPMADEHKIELKFDLPPKFSVIRGDRDKLALAMHNLLGNAIKYTPEGGGVTVKVEEDGKRFVFSVTDTGIGISEEDCERIFERFYRAKDERVEKITGTGLGLTLAREVVRLHGGDVTVQSELNKGSTFTIALPISAEAA